MQGASLFDGIVESAFSGDTEPTSSCGVHGVTDPFALFDLEDSPAVLPQWASAQPAVPTASSPDSLGPLLVKLSVDTLQSILVGLDAGSLGALAQCSHALRSAVEQAIEPACARLFAAAGLRMHALPERRSGEGMACLVKRAALRTGAGRTATLLAAGHRAALVVDPAGGAHLMTSFDELRCRRLRLAQRVRSVACGALHALLLLEGGRVVLVETRSLARTAEGAAGAAGAEGAEGAEGAAEAGADGGACWVTLVPEGGSEAVASVAAGAFHSLLVGAAGSLWSAGRNSNGQCGVGHSRSPVPCDAPCDAPQGGAERGARLDGGAKVARVAALHARAAQASGGGHHSLVLSQAGAVYAFGCNQGGRLGVAAGGARGEHGMRGARDLVAPRLVELGEAAVQVAAGGDYSVVLTESGSVLDLGGSGLHLAAETSHQTHLPGGPARRVKGLPPSLRIAAVSAGSDHTLGLPPAPHLMRATWLAFGSGLGSGSSPNPDSTPNPDSDVWPGECRLRPLRVYRQRGPCVELGSPGAHAA